VTELGTVTAQLPRWRLHWISSKEWGAVCTTALTLVIVILSQSAATSRTTSDDLGVDSDISRDFVGVGLANVAAGLVGAFPVNASPARSTVSHLAGGKTKVVGLSAAVLAIVLSPLSHYAHAIPLAALAGVLFFIAFRLIKLHVLAKIWRVSRVECGFALISGFGVILIGVEQGLAIAVALAILDQTWRSARPQTFALGRRAGTTSWEPLGDTDVGMVDDVLVLLFDNDIFFANAGVFRREVHQMLKSYPATQHLVLDAVAISDVDVTGLVMLSQVVDDVTKDGISFSLARAGVNVKATLAKSPDTHLRTLDLYESVDEAVLAATAASK
jgi:MFS superfamily sulfate permease-like transporter